jgi:outer membrane protein OmpA-like peptidoglycan-associated protein
MLVGACHRAPPPAPAGRAPVSPPAEERRGRVVVTDTDIEILPYIRFDGLTANVLPEALRTLDAIAATLDGNPNIKLVEVRAFGTDGDPKYQQVIGQQRADAIVGYLIKHGVAANRLRSRGIAFPPPGQDSRPVFEILRRGG